MEFIGHIITIVLTGAILFGYLGTFIACIDNEDFLLCPLVVAVSSIPLYGGLVVWHGVVIFLGAIMVVAAYKIYRDVWLGK